MNNDPSKAPTTDPRLSALYRHALGTTDGPSESADRQVLSLAAAALRPPRIAPAESGWRSWLHAQWFRPGLAFAAVASLSVVIVALLPKEDMSIERAENVQTAPAAAPPMAAAKSETAPPMASNKAEDPSGADSSSTAMASGVVNATPRAEMPASNSAGNVSNKKSTAEMTTPAPAVVARAPGTSLRSGASDGSAPDAESHSSTAKAERANPFPAQAPALARQRTESSAASAATPAAPGASPPAAAAASSPAGASPSSVQPAAPQPAPAAASAAGIPAAAPADGAAPAGTVLAPAAPPPAGRERPVQPPGKLSLQSESTESRMDASNQPLPEVRDAAPTYPNEQPPSPLPPARSSRPPRPADAGSLSKSAPAASAPALGQPSAPRRADAMMAQRAPQAAADAAPPLRNPDDWIKAIEKLRSEGKSEQVAKELADFRRAYPLHPLPDALKALLPK